MHQSTSQQLENLLTLYEERTDHPELYFSRIDDFFSVVIERTTLARHIRQPNDIASPGDFLRLIGFPFIRALVLEIQDQFTASPILQSFGVLDPRNMPSALDEIADFGWFRLTSADFSLFRLILADFG